MTDNEITRAFEARSTPNLDYTRHEDGFYRYESTQIAFFDFQDGWNARHNMIESAADEPATVEQIEALTRLVKRLGGHQKPVSIEVAAKALFDHEQNRPFPPKLTNITLYGQHPVTWDFINDDMFVRSCSDAYREEAKAVLDAAGVAYVD